MSNPELCCNCVHYEISCRDDGILPNDYCGMYESALTTDEENENNNDKPTSHLFNSLSGFASCIPQYLDNITDYQEEPNIKTKWLEKKMRKK